MLVTRNKRTLLTIIALILYVVAFNYYLYELIRTDFSHRSKVLLYNYSTLSMLVFFVLDLKAGFESSIHEDFNFVCILSVIINFITIILTHLTIISNPLPTFLSFNIGILIATLMILISGARHGYFKR